jgi:hypothetical protein
LAAGDLIRRGVVGWINLKKPCPIERQALTTTHLIGLPSFFATLQNKIYYSAMVILVYTGLILYP